ncbi:MAG: hypothetical protein M3O31_03920 [Acidobacteriota bacterium]|nr:hypothetical protein [Acidobacteriota bacterium]
MLFVGIVAGLGLLLASWGLMVISYSVTRQTQEIGIRMALGATLGQVQSHVIQRPLRLALIGIALESMASLVMLRSIPSLMFGMSARDLLTCGDDFVPGDSVTAGWVYSGAAWRVSCIDPMQALRNA